MAPMGYLGALGKLVHEKTCSRKSRVRLPLKTQQLNVSVHISFTCIAYVNVCTSMYRMSTCDVLTETLAFFAFLIL